MKRSAENSNLVWHRSCNEHTNKMKLVLLVCVFIAVASGKWQFNFSEVTYFIKTEKIFLIQPLAQCAKCVTSLMKYTESAAQRVPKLVTKNQVYVHSSVWLDASASQIMCVAKTAVAFWEKIVHKPNVSGINKVLTCERLISREFPSMLKQVFYSLRYSIQRHTK